MSDFWMLVIFLLVILLLSYFSTNLVRKIAVKKSIIDIPNHRSSHTIPTPRGGGLAIALVWFVFLIVWFVLGRLEQNLFLALLSGIIIAIVSFLDDLKGLSPKIRFISQAISSILGLYFLKGLQIIDLGFFSTEISLWSNIIIVIAMIWMINLFNFLDGIDGYLGMEGVYIFFMLFLITGNFIVLAFASIILGFLFWNWPRAKIFCGDVGSTLIGYTIVIFMIYFQNRNQLSILIPIAISSLFWVDASITLYRRWRNKEKLSEAHKKHAYQRLVSSGMSHKQVLYIGIGINVLIGIVAFLTYKINKFLIVSLIIQVILVYFFIRLADNQEKKT